MREPIPDATKIVHKRLERGTFTFFARVTGDAKSVAIDVHELAMVLKGIDVPRAIEASVGVTAACSRDDDRTTPVARRTSLRAIVERS